MMTRIKITDIHDNDHEFEGENLELSIEGVTTLVVKKTSTGYDILGSFINVAAAVKAYR